MDLAIFEGKSIRRTMHNGEWHFSVIDVIQALTDSDNPRNYWSMLKKRQEENETQLSTICVQLKLPSADGKQYETDCATAKSIFRIIQSIPSKKAEPFKLWLAQVGYERVQEIHDPELAQQRMKEIYRAKGYSDAWIEKRVRGIAVRSELTDEWSKRGIERPNEFAILTAEISKATFGMTPAEYKKHKNLDDQNLRDHMNDLELIFGMLGEASTTTIARSKEARGFVENKDAAISGGNVAGNARKELEAKSGKPVSTKENYLDAPESKKRISKKE